MPARSPRRCDIHALFRVPHWLVDKVDHGRRGELRRRLVGKRLDWAHTCKCACQRRLFGRCGPCLWCGR